jgi:hypothetical protein
LFANQLPWRLDTERATATRLGVMPLHPRDPGFDEVVNAGPVKWVTTEAGELLLIPKWVDGEELAHTVMANGQPVQAAGEASIVSGDGRIVGLEISNHSGHYLPSLESLEIGREAFRAFGITFP